MHSHEQSLPTYLLPELVASDGKELDHKKTHRYAETLENSLPEGADIKIAFQPHGPDGNPTAEVYIAPEGVELPEIDHTQYYPRPDMRHTAPDV